MPSYAAPLDDLRFLINDLFDMPNDPDVPGAADVTPDLIDAVLEGGAKICEQVFQPLNQSGDAEGCTWDNGVVRTPAGFKAAFDEYVGGGWHTLSLDPAWGGQGLPFFLSMAMTEMTVASNHALSTYIGLTSAVIGSLRGFGTDELKNTYIPPMVEGRWTGTMNLTEPHCGTDLRLMRTKAVPQDDGTYRVTGTKIFITGGEHDLAENIVHIVLARLPGAPEGTKGISLFIVPKFLPNEDGSVGERNAVSCGSLEHKMGIHGNATCVMNFDGAKGWLIGPENRGLNCMFTFMNTARIGTAIQGLGAAELGFQGSLAYAKDRLAMRSLSGPKNPEGPADPIIVQERKIWVTLVVRRTCIKEAVCLCPMAY